MEAHVNFESSSPRVPLVAALYLADEWFFACMSELVSLQVAFSDEFLVALVAHEGPLSGVGPHVGLQISCLGELFQAFFKRTKKYFFLVFRPLDFFELA